MKKYINGYTKIENMFVEDCFIPPITHRITVKCIIAKEFDTRSFSIHSTKKGHVIQEKVQKYINKYIEEEKQKIYFDTTETKYTHQLIIDEKHNRAFTFQFALSTHSATDIADILYAYLCNGRKKEWRKRT
jgi:hypothetical protein